MISAYWGFPIDPQLYRRILINVAELQLEETDQLENWRQRSGSLLDQLSQAALASYYQKPADLLDLEQPLRVTAEASAKVVMNSIATIVSQFLATLGLEQLKQLGSYLQGMLWWNPQDERPYLAFPMDERLYQSSRQLLVRIRTGTGCNHHIGDVIHAVSQIAESCIRHYYERPVAILGGPSLTHKLTELNINNVHRTIRTLVTRIVGQLTAAEVNCLSFHLETLIHPQAVAANSRLALTAS